MTVTEPTFAYIACTAEELATGIPARPGDCIRCRSCGQTHTLVSDDDGAVLRYECRGARLLAGLFGVLFRRYGLELVGREGGDDDAA